ncbi:hypothetical protein [Rossellomorea marisflavi]|uniref:hypothetical protein n=1 Tax=Rossellomorea marisflavi TaxID=189381 RepID=UPI00345B4A31
MQCSDGLPTLWEKRARGDLAGAAEAAHRTPHGKRVVAAERNDPISTTTPLQEQGDNSY